MDISKFLGKVIGIYLIIISLAMLLHIDRFNEMVSQLSANPPLVFTIGFFTLILGLLVVVIHNIWQWNWRVLITIIGWIALLKGTSLIIHPALIDILTSFYVQNTIFDYSVAIIDLILGIILVYFGFKHVNRNY